MNNEPYFKININKNDLERLVKIIYDNFGINLNEKKKILIENRLSSTLKNNGFTNFTEYIDYLESTKNKIQLIELIDKISTNHTYFFRESKHFDFLDKEILPELVEKILRSGELEIRIWSAGCSSGEESYTIAMILNEYIKSNKVALRIKILATDISITVLNEAKKGIYQEDSIKSLPKDLKLKYLVPIQDSIFQIENSLKEVVYFKKLNLMDKKFPFKKKFDLIFCRNVMIYFDENTRKNLVNKFNFHLKNDSYLLIGHSETIRGNKNFKYIMPAIYRKISD